VCISLERELQQKEEAHLNLEEQYSSLQEEVGEGAARSD
jgi:hypothetical protein